MNLLQRLGKFLLRGYKEVSRPSGPAFRDWKFNGQTEDGDLWAAAWALTDRTRDLFRENPLYQKYREVLWAQTFSDAGLLLRMQVKETEDRIITSAAEKAALRMHDERRNRIRKWAAEKSGRTFEPVSLIRELGSNGSRAASVKVGEPDIFANELIARRWKEWQRKEFCDLRGTRNYHTIRLLRLISAVRDGDFFLRLIRDPAVNKFGFALQLINAEYCDRFLNSTLPDGNVIRLGIEYQHTAYGLGKPVAYYFIKRAPSDWQITMAGLFSAYPSASMHVRIDARDILHYARPVDAEGTRPAPWVCSAILNSRQLNEYSIAEVIAARVQACKIGYLYSDVLPEGGAPETIDPRKSVPTQEISPGSIVGLEYGVKYQESNPTHPTANFAQFSQEQIRRICAAMPGSNYSEIANDYAAINFSAGRLQRLTSDAISYMLQRFDIDTAEIPIFEAWLEMALLTGAIPLPAAKFDKFNRPFFQGPRSPGVDPVKDVNAASFRIANNLSSWTSETADLGEEFRAVVEQKAEDLMLMDEFGLDPSLTASKPMPVNDIGAASVGETTMAPNNQPAKELAPGRLNLDLE